MRLVAFLLLLIGAALPLEAQTLERDWPLRTTTSPRVVKVFEEEKIPHLYFEDLPFLEAVELVRQIWKTAHPDLPFPVFIRVYREFLGPPIPPPPIPGLEDILGFTDIPYPVKPSYTFDEKQISYSAAIYQISVLLGYRVKAINGALMLQEWDDQLAFHRFRLTRRQALDLGLEPASGEEFIRAEEALMKRGIVFEGLMSAFYQPQDRLLRFRTYLRGAEQLEAILRDLNKRPHRTPGAK